MRLLSTFLPALLLLMATAAAAATWRVPVDQPDLPTALGAAADGDTILVAASHLVAGGLDLPPRLLVISGGWDEDFNEVVDRTPVSAPATGSSVRLVGPSTGTLTFSGFRISGGNGEDRTAPHPGRYGGGLLVESAAAVLRDLVISGGLLGQSDFGAGGGLALLETDALLEASLITSNQATWGGGIYTYRGSPTLSDVDVIDNDCGPDMGPATAQGAGVLAYRTTLTMRDGTISGGRGAVNGGGLAWLGGRGEALEALRYTFEDNDLVRDGGGVYADGGSSGGGQATLVDCAFLDNAPAAGADFTSGGGAYLTGIRAEVAGCLFRGNSAAAGGGITVNTGPEVTVHRNVFWSNQADLFGAAINYQSNDAGSVSDNTLASNTNPGDAGVLNLVQTSPTLVGNLVAFNDGAGVSVSGGSVSPACNNVVAASGTAWLGIPDPTGQDGNLAVDPLFCDLNAGDLTLRDDSPCLDAPGCGDTIGALGIGCSVGVAAPAPGGSLLVQAFPNPANPAVSIRCVTPRDGRLKATIHDARGRLVRRLVDQQVTAGATRLRWDGRDLRGRAAASGRYLVRLTLDDRDLITTGLTLLR